MNTEKVRQNLISGTQYACWITSIISILLGWINTEPLFIIIGLLLLIFIEVFVFVRTVDVE